MLGTLFSFIPLLIVCGIVFGLFKFFFRSGNNSDLQGNRYICSACGTKTPSPQRYTKGSIFIEIALWLCFLLPGIIYSIWRLTSKQQVCPTCKNPSLIPLNTPAGKKYEREFAPIPEKSSFQQMTEELDTNPRHSKTNTTKN